MIQNNHSKAMDSSTTLHTEDAPIWEHTYRELDKHEVTVRLLELILNMPDADLFNLLKNLEEHHFSEISERPNTVSMPQEEMRAHPRKTSLIAVDCETHDVCFTNFIQDISNGGVFIETNAHFYLGQQLKMNFSLPEAENPFTVDGKVIRVNQQGIGVQFIGGDVERIDITG
jgi:Tfp pilus assembly protein PilZ